MGNLGWYQRITTWSKKVGGPLQLMAVVGASGYAVGKVIEISSKKVIKKVKKHNSTKRIETKIYTVHTSDKSNEGLAFEVGDKYRILEKDGDAVLIEKLNDNNNPYFVSEVFLKSISN